MAKVDKSGKITAVKAGTAKITVKSLKPDASGKYKTTVLTVKVVNKKPSKAKANVKKVSASGVPKSMAAGTTKAIKGTYKPTTAIAAKVTYKSSKPDILLVDKVGTLKAKKAGKVILTVKAGKKTKKYTITVK